MNTSPPKVALVKRLEPLWVLLSGGAFVSFAGSFLTLLYFWSIGGIPIGQAAGTSANASAVFFTALWFAGLFLLIWVAPTILFVPVTDESPFAQRLRQMFLQVGTVAAAGQEPVAYSTVRLGRLIGFALFTVGSGCLALTLLSLGAGPGQQAEWTWETSRLGLGLPVVITTVALIVQWRRFNSTDSRGWDLDLASWFAFGFGSTLVTLFPLILLLFVYVQTDFFLQQESTRAFLVGAFFISVGIVAAYVVSLAVLMRRRQGAVVLWGAVLSVNAVTLFAIVVVLGMSSRMLDAVMVMSSVRVEHAVMLLESEGCEQLEAMQATGWARTVGASNKTCTLYDVTIQSTLEPTMQVACWRGTLVKKKNGEEAPPARPASAASSAASAAAAVASAPVATQPPQIDVETKGSRGAFTLPAKYVRSVWKTSGVSLTNLPFVCPQSLAIINGTVPAATVAPAASSPTK